MDNVSVSKGVFVHKGSYKIGDKNTKFVAPDYLTEPWYLSYEETWTTIQNAIENIRSTVFQQILDGIEHFVFNFKEKSIESLGNEIQTAIVLTGINVPDHAIMFTSIISKLEPITKHTAVIWSRDSNNLKSILEETIFQLINHENMDENEQVKKSQCNMRALKYWYQNHCQSDDPLIIIISDFESFLPAVLRDFILILSSYSSSIKFVVIFGVATTLHAVHRSLTYDVTSKLNVQVFHIKTQINILSDVLENIIFSPKIPFMLTGRAFQLLTDMFLFYDFSVENFLQSYKICMIQHFYGNNINSLCCDLKHAKARMSALTDEDIEEIKKLPSVVKYIKQFQRDRDTNESLKNEEFKELLFTMLKQFHRYAYRFMRILRCLHDLMSALPNAPMGKQLREFYSKLVCVNDLRDCNEYKDCLQLLSFLSRQQLLSHLNSILSIINEFPDLGIQDVKVNLQSHIKKIESASLEEAVAPTEIISSGERLNRLQLKEKLLKMSQTHSRSPYKQAQLDAIDFLDRSVFSVYLTNPNRMPAHEIFCFSDGSLARQHIRGSLRAAVHMGLNDPQVYLNCGCCKLENDEAIPSTLPDLSIIYKLHLESRKLINMYDWLQAFLIIVNPVGEAKEQRDVDPKLQARFTQAVAELEFLGFIKSSRKKTDHVKRLV
ncbi:origin recognition complex subunit 3 [Hylaeus volcanicus]|uniref:origin recognition complex subunit 3 n=1 Tax=Hylaeus volcanicus TaxID=313075 RepID=UPI0023B8204D|nr:origin recognition complex subunit 3 [Hylaeus volcanicus]